MTPFDKARFLVELFYKNAIPALPPGYRAEFRVAKECALLALDEIIKEVTVW